MEVKMAKDITLDGLITVILLQLSCTTTYCAQIKTGEANGVYNFNNVVYNRTRLGDLNYKFHTLPTRIHPKQGEHLNNLLWKVKTHIANANIEQGDQNTPLGKFTRANNQHMSTSQIVYRNGAKSELSSAYRKTKFDKQQKSVLSNLNNGLPLTRQKRSTSKDYSQTHAQRFKRDLSDDTEIGLIFGACVLGLLTAFLLICACIRCNAVRKSEDGKGTVPDYTPTLFAVAKGYDNVAFDNDDPRTEAPSNEIPMAETSVNGQTYQTVSVA